MKRLAIDLNDVCRQYSNNLKFYYNKWVNRSEGFDPDNVKYSKEDDLYSCIPFKNEKERLDFITQEFVYELNGAVKPVDPFFGGKFSAWLNNIEEDLENNIEILVICPFERDLERQATFFFLTKAQMRVKKVLFAQSFEELWDNADILITANPKLLKDVPDGKTTIKIKTEYNKKCKSTYEYDSFMDFIAEENKETITKIIKN